MSRKAILRIAALVLALAFGVALGQVVGVLMAKGKAVVATVLDVTRGPTFDAPAPSDNVVDWQPEPSASRQRPKSAGRVSHEMYASDRDEGAEAGTLPR
jgi:hypothetical protein